MNRIPNIFKVVFETSPGLICLLDKDKRMLFINKIGANKLGYEPDELIGMELISPERINYAEFKRYWDSVNTRPTATLDIDIKTKAGVKTFWEITSQLVHFRGKVYYLCIGNDNTDKFDAQKDLEIADKLYDLNLNRLHKTLLDLQHAKKIAEENAMIKQQFLANISHEIRTPMNAIIGFSNVLLKSKLGSKELQYVDAIKKSSDNLMSIINEILDLSKLESGNFGFDEVYFELSEVIDSVKMLFELRIADKNIEFDIEISQTVQNKLIGDSGRLYQVLVNLVGNAIKFTEKGFIKIVIEEENTTSENTTLKFSVIDTGIGIEDENVKKVFESFTQASSDTSRKYGGTGLGLTICKQLIELQGGTIYVESEFGKGSTFSFVLCFKIAFSTAPAIELQTPNYKISSIDNIGKYKILLVEDNEINVFLASKIIEDWGFLYKTAFNGKEAISLLNKEKFDIVLMDIQMPIMDGYEAIKLIRNSDKKYNKIPIIATTAHAAKGESEKTIKFGFNDYISKPFKLEVLLQKILTLLNNSSETIKPKFENEYSTKEIVNLEYLYRVAGGDNKFIEKMIYLFVNQTESVITGLRKDLNKGNWDGFRAKIHKVLPSISFMGISLLNDELNEIDEAKVKPSDFKMYFEIVDKLELIMKRASIELNNSLALNSNLEVS